MGCMGPSPMVDHSCLGPGCPEAGVGPLVVRARASWSQGWCWSAGGWAESCHCRLWIAVILGLMSTCWWEGRGPSGSWSWCLPTGGWSWVLGFLTAGPWGSWLYGLHPGYTSVVYVWVVSWASSGHGQVQGWLWAKGDLRQPASWWA